MPLEWLGCFSVLVHTLLFWPAPSVPEWLLILGTVPRMRRLYDLLRYFHALEVRPPIPAV